MARRWNQGESPTSPRRIASAKKAAQALKLREAGATFAEIAKAVGYNSSPAAFMAVKSALERTLQEPADEYRIIMRERAEKLIHSLWKKAVKGDVHSCAEIRKQDEHLARILGIDRTPRLTLDAEQVNVQNNVVQIDLKDLSEDDLNAYSRVLAAFAKQAEQGTAAGGNGKAQAVAE